MKHKLWYRVRDQLEFQVSSQAMAQVYYSVEDQVVGQVMEEVRYQFVVRFREDTKV